MAESGQSHGWGDVRGVPLTHESLQGKDLRQPESSPTRGMGCLLLYCISETATGFEHVTA